ncbi:MAG: hypothetical protein RJA70_1044 [Pseudomonadota bacterium]|jgi:tetratricopeptide (TPR) repeat protein
MNAPSIETRPTLGSKLRKWRVLARPRLRSAWLDLKRHFQQQPTFWVVFPALLLLSVALYVRSPWTNYIFDEQEALLANPYVNGGELRFWQVFERDFWGLPSTRSIGSYRPLPNIIWRLLWLVREHAWLPHCFNVIVHAANGALIALLALRWMGTPRHAWLSGVTFVAAAVITEAVCGVVGIADVLSGFFTLLVLWAFQKSLVWQFPAALAFLLLGLLSKESTLTVTPLVVWAALLTAPLDHPRKAQRWLRALLVGLGAISAVVAYTYFRRHFFPVTLPAELQMPLPESEPWVKRAFHEFLRWFQQPRLPADPINNPLVSGDKFERISGALRVYFRGLVQVVFPWQLSGDYSFPQEPLPTKLFNFESVMGGLLLVFPPLSAVGLWLRALWAERSEPTSARVRALVVIALTLVWVPVSYFPHSNIPVVLPTVRAERFWYLPVIASALLIGLALALVLGWTLRRGRVRAAGVWVVGLFLGFQVVRARAHALDYRNDLAFWRATAQAAPNSAKAHLNYGVMLGARNRLEERLVENRLALELAPRWPMAHVYYGDTLCRLKRIDEAWPHYVSGFKLGPNDQGLISLALQCLWDGQAIEARKAELTQLGDDPKYKGTWLAYLAHDIVRNGEKHKGVDPKHRPRGYNKGPRSDK